MVRDQGLQPVAVLRTTRTERHLYDADGTDLAVLADDTVEAERLVGTPGQFAWRELEVELVDGDDAVLQSVAETLAAGGVSPVGLVVEAGQGPRRRHDSQPLRARDPEEHRRPARSARWCRSGSRRRSPSC